MRVTPLTRRSDDPTGGTSVQSPTQLDVTARRLPPASVDDRVCALPSGRREPGVTGLTGVTPPGSGAEAFSWAPYRPCGPEEETDR